MQLITGNKFKLMSDFIYDEKGLKKNEIVFAKTKTERQKETSQLLKTLDRVEK